MISVKKLRCNNLFLCLCLSFAFLFSCTTTQSAVSFSERTIADFSYHKLDNGIPVIIKKSAENRLVNLQLIVKGGSASIPNDRIYSEQAVFDLLSRGSQSYPYEKINALCYAMQASLAGSSGPDYSVFSLHCIDYYFNDLFPIFADSFRNPAFSIDQFNLITDEYRQQIQSVQSEPFSLLQHKANESLYRNHPYQNSTISDVLYVDSLTLETLRKCHAEMLNADRLSFVAVGNFDVKELLSLLNSTFGSLPSKTFTCSEIPQADFTGEPMVVTSVTAKNTVYAMRTFPIPVSNTREYAAFALAAQVYDDVLFNIVREKHGSCYSVWNGAGLNGTYAPYGMLCLYKADGIAGMPGYLAEAADIMERGNVILGKNGDTYTEVQLESRLEGYKNSYINSVFSSLRTSSGVASRIISGYMLHGEPTRYVAMIDIIRSITAADVAQAYQKYWYGNENRWFFVCGDDMTKSISAHSFK